jgi:probable rRNA maturation factor
MRLEINNTTKQKINTKILQPAADNFGKKMKANKKSVSVAFVSEAAIKKINNQYRGINKVTDILSFSGEGENFGELIICYSQIKRQAKKQKHAVGYELLFIFVHGLLHLAGYDDKTDKEREEMIKLGEKLCKSVCHSRESGNLIIKKR